MGRILDIDEINEERRKACDYFFDESGSCYGCAFYCEECVYDDDGKITDCYDVCYINDIRDKKKTKLKENINILEDYSKTIELSLNELKNIFKKMNENKDE